MVLPVLVTLALGSIDFGRFAYNYIAVNNAARAGAAYGVMNSYLPSQASAWQTAIQTTATNDVPADGFCVQTDGDEHFLHRWDRLRRVS